MVTILIGQSKQAPRIDESDKNNCVIHMFDTIFTYSTDGL